MMEQTRTLTLVPDVPTSGLQSGDILAWEENPGDQYPLHLRIVLRVEDFVDGKLITFREGEPYPAGIASLWAVWRELR